MAATKPHIYLFHGTDTHTTSQKVRHWQDEFKKKYGTHNAAVIDCEVPTQDSPIAIKNFLQSNTLFDTTKFAVIRNFFGKKNESVELVLERIASLPASHFLVFHEGKIDGRTVLYKKFLELEKSGLLIREEYSVPTGVQLLTWVEKRFKEYGAIIEKSAVLFFCEIFSPANTPTYKKEDAAYDLWLLNSEIQKCVAFAAARSITIADIKLLVCAPESGHVFDLEEMILDDRIAETHRIMHSLLDGNASKTKSTLIGALSNLTSQFRGMIIVKDLAQKKQSEAAIAESLGWNAKRVWVVLRKSQKHSLEKLIFIYRALLEFDTILKVTRLSADIPFDLLIQKITTKNSAR